MGYLKIGRGQTGCTAGFGQPECGTGYLKNSRPCATGLGGMGWQGFSQLFDAGGLKRLPENELGGLPRG